MPLPRRAPCRAAAATATHHRSQRRGGGRRRRRSRPRPARSPPPPRRAGFARRRLRRRRREGRGCGVGEVKPPARGSPVRRGAAARGLGLGAGRVLSAFIAPAAAAGVVGYAYMWWKGITFSSIMYVTKQNMANAVSSMTKHLEQVQNSLAAAKRHLTQRIQRLDDKLDKQKEISGHIRDEVTGARLKLKDIGVEMENLKKLAFNMDGKLDSIQDKQDCQLAGVSYLLQFIEPNGAMRPGRLEGLQRPVLTRTMKQGELPGLEFGLRLLALEKSSSKGAGLALPSPPVKAAC